MEHACLQFRHHAFGVRVLTLVSAASCSRQCRKLFGQVSYVVTRYMCFLSHGIIQVVLDICHSCFVYFICFVYVSTAFLLQAQKQVLRSIDMYIEDLKQKKTFDTFRGISKYVGDIFRGLPVH